MANLVRESDLTRSHRPQTGATRSASSVTLGQKKALHQRSASRAARSSPPLLRIPRELELDASEATIRRDGERLIVEPMKRRPDLATLLAG